MGRPSSWPSPLELDGLEVGNVPEDLEDGHRRHPVPVMGGFGLPPMDPIEKFTFAQIQAATNGFSQESKIGEGSSHTVYHGHLPNGREVAIMHRKSRQLLEREFLPELTFLSRLPHKHLVNLVGYCVENNMLVCEYMKNGTLYDHLRAEAASLSSPSLSLVMSSWKLRIRILLDASRGIEYLHSCTVRPIIHRDIKSSNILLDANWRARVSLMVSEAQVHHRNTAAGVFRTVDAYMDPEYYSLKHLTAKSDVYSFGVVMLEVLTGRPAAIFWKAEGPLRLVDYTVPSIVSGELGKVLDPLVPEPAAHEAEAVELVAYTAVHCVRLEAKDRPVMADIVTNLEAAFALCEGNFDGDLVKRPSSDSLPVVTPIDQD